jgi:hypothetical protein
MMCIYAGRGGPCWGKVELVDTVDTESQHLDTYACQGHVDVALYGYDHLYRPQGFPCEDDHDGQGT